MGSDICLAMELAPKSDEIDQKVTEIDQIQGTSLVGRHRVIGWGQLGRTKDRISQAIVPLSDS